MSKLKSIYVTFKKDEELICNYANNHSSPAAYIKDLIRDDMEKRTNNSNHTKDINYNMFD